MAEQNHESLKALFQLPFCSTVNCKFFNGIKQKARIRTGFYRIQTLIHFDFRYTYLISD